MNALEYAQHRALAQDWIRVEPLDLVAQSDGSVLVNPAEFDVASKAERALLDALDERGIEDEWDLIRALTGDDERARLAVLDEAEIDDVTELRRRLGLREKGAPDVRADARRAGHADADVDAFLAAGSKYLGVATDKVIEQLGALPFEERTKALTAISEAMAS